MRTKTYLLAINGGDYSEAACALVELGEAEAAAVKEARAVVRSFAERHQGWCSLEWGWTLRCAVLTRVPDALLNLLGVADADELFAEGQPSWRELPAAFAWPESGQFPETLIPDDEVWRSECEGLRCSADSVYFTALSKYTSERVESDDLEALFFPPAAGSGVAA